MVGYQENQLALSMVDYLVVARVATMADPKVEKLVHRLAAVERDDLQAVQLVPRRQVGKMADKLEQSKVAQRDFQMVAGMDSLLVDRQVVYQGQQYVISTESYQVLRMIAMLVALWVDNQDSSKVELRVVCLAALKVYYWATMKDQSLVGLKVDVTAGLSVVTMVSIYAGKNKLRNHNDYGNAICDCLTNCFGNLS